MGEGRARRLTLGEAFTDRSPPVGLDSGLRIVRARAGDASGEPAGLLVGDDGPMESEASWGIAD